MKRVFPMILLLLFLTGCNRTPGAWPEPTREEPAVEATVQLLGDTLGRSLNLREGQLYEVRDYTETYILLLITDPDKKPDAVINDQFLPVYCDKFVLYDTAACSVVKEYPIDRFGYCPSAVYAFDGVAFSFFSVTDALEMDSAVLFTKGEAPVVVHQGSYSPFDAGPVLHRSKCGVLFSYHDYQTDEFGLSLLDPNLRVTSVLDFTAADTDYISDDFASSSNYAVYAAGQDPAVVFYVVQADDLSTPFPVVLSAGEKIHGFTVNDEVLYVSVTESEGGKGETPCVKTADLKTGQWLDALSMDLPLYRITANEENEICGFQYSTFCLYRVDGALHKESLGDTLIQGDFGAVFSWGERFLVALDRMEGSPRVWLISPP